MPPQRDLGRGATKYLLCVCGVVEGGTPRVAIEQKRVRIMRKEGRGYLFRIAKNAPSP